MDDKTYDTLVEIKSILAEQRVILSEHIRRTEALEESVSLLRDELEPIKVHVAVVGAAGKVIGVLGTLVGIVAGVMKLMS